MGVKAIEKISPKVMALNLYCKSMWDRDMNGHSIRVSKYAKKIAENMNLNQHTIDKVETLGIIHDIGKLHIPRSIINKKGKLTPDEWNVMKRHPIEGQKIVTRIPELACFAPLVLLHHEAWDGSGYPLGISGEKIPLEVRILSVADAYDAMTSVRPYRDKMSREEAIEELVRMRGRQFWSRAVDAMIDVLSKE